jgi:DNA-binding SARP family transcriptional activator
LALTATAKAEELGVAPSTQLRELIERATRGDHGDA